MVFIGIGADGDRIMEHQPRECLADRRPGGDAKELVELDPRLHKGRGHHQQEEEQPGPSRADRARHHQIGRQHSGQPQQLVFPQTRIPPEAGSDKEVEPHGQGSKQGNASRIIGIATGRGSGSGKGSGDDQGDGKKSGCQHGKIADQQGEHRAPPSPDQLHPNDPESK